MCMVVAVCGKIGSGKTTYAHKLRIRMGAALLSVDEVMLALFGRDAGEAHDALTARLQQYLLRKSCEMAASGIPVILDWGFWTKEKRQAVAAFYRERGIPCQFHYLAVDDTLWRARIRQRNADVLAGKTDAYPVDEGLMEKFSRLFEPPDKSEIDVWVENP